MKIYFAGSIRAGRQDADLYMRIIRFLQQYGEVLTEHVGDDEQVKREEKTLSDRDIHDRDVAWIKASDLLVAEVTTPSLGVGYEIRYALDLGKRVVCLFNGSGGKRLSAMISGAAGIEIILYNEEHSVFRELEKALPG